MKLSRKIRWAPGIAVLLALITALIVPAYGDHPRLENLAWYGVLVLSAMKLAFFLRDDEDILAMRGSLVRLWLMIPLQIVLVVLVISNGWFVVATFYLVVSLGLEIQNQATYHVHDREQKAKGDSV